MTQPQRIGISASAPVLPSMARHAPTLQEATLDSGLEGDSEEFLRNLRPSTSWASSTMGNSTLDSARPRSVMRSDRFSPEIRACFKRVKTPSSSCEGKAQVYWQTQGFLKKSLSEGANCWHTLPVLKGKFYSQDRLLDASTTIEVDDKPAKKVDPGVSPLPDEMLTSVVLDEIYPTGRSPVKGVRRDSACDYSPEKVFASRKSMILSRASLIPLQKNGKGQPLLGSTSSSTFGPGASSSGAAGASSRLMNTTGSLPGADSDPPPKGTRSIAPISCFRQLLEERFHTVNHGLHIWDGEFPKNKVLRKKDFRHILMSRMGDPQQTEVREAMFNCLDLDGDGLVGFAEFHFAVEAAAPVTSLAELRRRWLATGFKCMNSALREMSGKESISSKPLTLREFGDALCSVHVTEIYEHAALFSIFADAKESSSRVSVAELAGAISTVSPNLLLEELRERLANSYKASHRCVGLGGELQLGSSEISQSEFVSQALRRFGVTELEAQKLFRVIDFHQNGHINRKAFKTALAMVEPSLHTEDLRRKVYQRFRSMKDVFSKAFEEDDPRWNAKLQFEELQRLLMKIDLTEAEIEQLLKLMDVDNSGSMSITEFFRGAYQFIPLCAFEDLRLDCLQRHPDIPALLGSAETEQATTRMDFPAFEQKMNELDVFPGCDEHLQAMFDTLDVQSQGFVMMSVLIALLQAGGPGSIIKQEDDVLRSRAKQDIRGYTASVHRLVGDLKAEAREGKHYDEHSHGHEEPCSGSCKKRRESILKADSSAFPRPSSVHTALAPRLQTAQQPNLKGYALQQASLGPRSFGPHSRAGDFKKLTEKHISDPQQSWGAVWRSIQNAALDKDDKGTVEADLKGYYEEALSSLSGDVPLLEQPPSRQTLHQSMNAHKSMLESDVKRRILQRTGPDKKASESIGKQALPPVV